MTETVSVVEYRLIRPDGTVLWTALGASYQPVPAPPTRPSLAQYPEVYVLPPWRYEARESGGDWVLLGEDAG